MYCFNFLDNDANEFYIVSLDNKQWHFDAASSEERDEWVCRTNVFICQEWIVSRSNQDISGKKA